MKTIHTIGFTKKSLQEFIGLLKKSKITKVLDIRLNNDSPLAGFSRSRDLKYLLGLVGIKYEIVPEFFPSPELFEQYRKDKDWDNYEKQFSKLIKERNLKKKINLIFNQERICLLCSEEGAEKCHRRLLAEYFAKLGKGKVKHL